MRPLPLLVVATALATIGAATPAHAATAAPHPIHTWHGDQANERFGWAVSQLGDIDGDGVQEAIIGAARHTDDQGRVDGHTDVRSGRTGKLLYRFTGAPDDVHGYAMADAGDVNRDGVPDIVVGATGESQLACLDTPRPGRIYVYSGRSGRELLKVGGEADGDQFGAAVGAAGDVDGDGRADLLVGAPCHDGPAGADAGKAYVVSGRTGKILRTHDGAEAGDALGWGAAGLGDITGDHRADYIVGAKDAGPGDRGLAYVYDGRRGTTRFTLAGNEKSFDFGWFFVATAGRVDGDRVPDIYVGDFCAEDATDQCALPAGQAYVFSGRTGERLHLFRGDQPNDGAGPGRSAGDVDRDGRDDIAVGFYSSSAGASQAGRLVVYSGRTGRVLRDMRSSVANELLGYDAVGIGDVNRDGRVDLLVSAAGGDTVYVLGT
ncbi:integrin alpha [Actinoplanes sp. CA-142083]|uniref:integrin alpha n=1 Tax=Actinoplanes sp. CA-142083 TaxID=3239903 RepID=UPI003D8F5ED2